MNHTYFVDLSSWFVVTFLVVSFISTTFSNIFDWLNSNDSSSGALLKKLHKISPVAPKLFSASKIRKAREYKQTRESFGDAVSTFQSGAKLLCVVFGLTPFMAAGFSRLFPSLPPVWCWIATVLVLTTASSLLDIPFDFYRTFVIEKRFGFNHTTKKLFAADCAKSILIGAGFITVVIYAIDLMLRHLPDFGMAATAAFTASFIIMTKLASAFSSLVVFPLFNRLTPLEDRNLLRKIDGLCARCGFKCSGVFVMDASRRTGHSNAFIYNRLGRKRIVIFDTALKTLTPDEIVAIVGHEIGHGKLHHLLYGEAIGTALTAVTVTATFILMKNPEFYNAFGYTWVTEANLRDNMIIGFSIASMFVGAFTWLATPLRSWLSRRMEYAADAYAVRRTRSRRHLTTALLKLTSDNLAELFPHPAYEAVFHSHPSILNRTGAICRTKLDRKE